LLTGKLPVLFLLVPTLLMAQEGYPAVAPKRKISIASLLPPGSLLAGVMLPRYDEDRCLVGVLHANSMTFVTSEILDGKAVSIESFNPDRSSNVRMDLASARFDQSTGALSTRESVKIRSADISTDGAGLIYKVDQAKGFLMGPVITRIKAPPKTTMTTSTSPLRATAIVGTSLLAMPLAAAPAGVVAVPRDDAASLSQSVAAANAQTRADLRTVLSASVEATRAATTFLEQEDLIAKAASVAVPPVAIAKPLDVTPGPNDTVINCDGGMYFDSNQYLLVYLKNVTVADPRFTLDGANEIKVFFEKKTDTKPESKPKPNDKPEIKSNDKPEPEPKPEPKPSDKPEPKSNDRPTPGGMNVKMGDVERVVATGAVHILQKPDANNEAIEAAGALCTYNFKTGEIILSGGKPWVRKGGMINRSKQSNQTLRIIEGKFTFSEGGTETILPLDQIKRKDK
jgi:hypothetical protein